MHFPWLFLSKSQLEVGRIIRITEMDPNVREQTVLVGADLESGILISAGHHLLQHHPSDLLVLLHVAVIHPYVHCSIVAGDVNRVFQLNPLI